MRNVLIEFIFYREQQDARVAEQLAEMIEREEEERRRMLEEEDKELAKYLQEKEQQRIEKRERDRRELESHTPRKERSHHSDERKVQIPKGPIFVSLVEMFCHITIISDGIYKFFSCRQKML